MNKRNTWVLGAVLAGLLAGGLWWAGGRGKPAPAVAVARGDLVQTLVTTGRISTPARLDIGTEVTGTVLAVPVREGDTVAAGQVLVQLRDDEAQASLVQARAALAEAQTRQQQLDQLGQPLAQAALQQAEASWRVARQEHERAQALVAQGFYAPQKLDEARRQLDTSAAALDSARLQARAQQPGGVERHLAAQRLAQAQAALEAAQARLARLRLSSPVAATVLSRPVEPGSLAQPGRVLMTLAAQGPLRIDASIDEKHLPLLRLGLPARALADAYPQTPFDAVLDHLAPGVDAQRGTVDVRLTLPQPPAFVRPDMTVSVELQAGARRGVLTLASDAVRGLDSAQPWALVAREGRARRVDLQLGLRGLGAVEVTQGLAEGDWVLLPTPGVLEGDRVRPQPPASKSRGMDIPPGLSR